MKRTLIIALALAASGCSDHAGPDPTALDIATMVVSFDGHEETVSHSCISSVINLPLDWAVAVTVSFRRADGSPQTGVNNGDWHVDFGSGGGALGQLATGDFKATIFTGTIAGEWPVSYALVYEPTGAIVVGPCWVTVEVR